MKQEGFWASRWSRQFNVASFYHRKYCLGHRMSDSKYIYFSLLTEKQVILIIGSWIA